MEGAGASNGGRQGLRPEEHKESCMTIKDYQEGEKLCMRGASVQQAAISLNLTSLGCLNFAHRELLK